MQASTFRCARLPPTPKLFSRCPSMLLSPRSLRREMTTVAAAPAVPNTAVQRLYVACREVFSCAKGQVPPPAGVQRIKAILDVMTPEDVDLTPEMPYFQNFGNRKIPHISYLHLYECKDFSIGIFCFPDSATIPLHNHPGMIVFSKLLFGSMQVLAYDWATDKDLPSYSTKGFLKLKVHGARLAKVKVDATFVSPCGASILYPEDGGNMHCFTSKTPCAVLDVLAPPYDEDEGRQCTYYSDISSAFPGDMLTAESGERFALLKEGSAPVDFVVKGAPYRGPKISEF